MQVATVDDAGRPSLRTVLAKAIDERGVIFYTNYDSAKGRDLDARPYAALHSSCGSRTSGRCGSTGAVQRVSRGGDRRRTSPAARAGRSSAPGRRRSRR